MTDEQAAAPGRKRRPAATTAMEKRLLSEVLDLKDQVHGLVVAIERNTNAHASSQMLAQRDVAQLVTRLEKDEERLGTLEVWQQGIETERSEQRGAARVRKSLLAIVAGLASLFGGVVVALVNWLLRGVGQVSEDVLHPAACGNFPNKRIQHCVGRIEAFMSQPSFRALGHHECAVVVVGSVFRVTAVAKEIVVSVQRSPDVTKHVHPDQTVSKFLPDNSQL